MKKTIEFILSKVIAIASIVLGIHLMAAHIEKVLPFGIQSENLVLWGIWAYTGMIVALVIIIYGLMLLFRKTWSREFRRLKREVQENYRL